MRQIITETRKRVVRKHIQDGSSLVSLAAEYGVSKATVSNWVHAYREECQTNDTEKSQLELMEEVRKLRQEKAELEKENNFLKKSAAFFFYFVRNSASSERYSEYTWCNTAAHTYT